MSNKRSSDTTPIPWYHSRSLPQLYLKSSTIIIISAVKSNRDYTNEVFVIRNAAIAMCSIPPVPGTVDALMNLFESETEPSIIRAAALGTYVV